MVGRHSWRNAAGANHKAAGTKSARAVLKGKPHAFESWSDFLYFLIFEMRLGSRAVPASLVAQKILEAATSDNPKLRHLTGKHVEQATAKKSMSDEEFYAMMKGM